MINHICRNRKCVNPKHLEIVTNQENCQKGLSGFLTGLRQRAKTHCPQGHKYTYHNTYVTRKGKRMCRTCNAIRDLKRKKRGET